MTKMKPETYALLQRHVAKFIPLERKAKQFEERKAIWNALWEANKEGLSLKAVYEDWSLMDDHVHTALCRLAREVRASPSLADIQRQHLKDQDREANRDAARKAKAVRS